MYIPKTIFFLPFFNKYIQEIPGYSYTIGQVLEVSPTGALCQIKCPGWNAALYFSFNDILFVDE